MKLRTMMIVRIALWSALLITGVFIFASCRPDLPEQSTVQQQKIQQEIDAVKQISDCNLKLAEKRLIEAIQDEGATRVSHNWVLQKSISDIKKDILKLQEPKPIIEHPMSLPDRVEQVSDSVVHIYNNTQGWQGSGVVITEDIILTARHVVEGGVDFTITLSDCTKLRTERAISSKKYDLGFIKLDKSDPNYVILKPVRLGSVKDCKLGQQVFVIGSPYGKLNFNSITLGIVSGLNRNFDEWAMEHGYTEYGWSVTFTTDAAGHPGNSGCPVFTMDGRVRGILVGGFSPVLIYCVPIDLVAKDLSLIDIMFALDNYEFEEVQENNWDGYNQSME